MSGCAVPDCAGKRHSRGYCPKHYQRWKRYGDPQIVRFIHRNDEARFWLYVTIGTAEPAKLDGLPCWLWTAETTRLGYGRFSYITASGRHAHVAAHRWAYEQLVGDIPDGLHLDHLCRIPGCVNPYHMDPVPCRINLLRGETLQAANAAKTHCDSGHEFDVKNTYWRPNGARACRKCHVRWRQDYLKRRRQRAES